MEKGSNSESELIKWSELLGDKGDERTKHCNHNQTPDGETDKAWFIEILILPGNFAVGKEGGDGRNGTRQNGGKGDWYAKNKGGDSVDNKINKGIKKPDKKENNEFFLVEILVWNNFAHFLIIAC